MSEVSALTELANFIGRSALSSENALVRRRAMDGIGTRLMRPQQPRRTVAELLSAVLVFSSRNRRLAQPRAQIDLDVFAPGGKRAVRISFGERP